MATATMTKMGNSLGVAIPKSIRVKAGFSEGTKLAVVTPREGVVVLTEERSAGDKEERLALLEDMERWLCATSENDSWPEGVCADELIDAGKREKANEFLSL